MVIPTMANRQIPPMLGGIQAILTDPWESQMPLHLALVCWKVYSLRPRLRPKVLPQILLLVIYLRSGSLLTV